MATSLNTRTKQEKELDALLKEADALKTWTWKRENEPRSDDRHLAKACEEYVDGSGAVVVFGKKKRPWSEAAEPVSPLSSKPLPSGDSSEWLRSFSRG